MRQYNENLKVKVEEDPKQPTKAFVDVNELPDHGVLLPNTPDPNELAWKACDQRDADYTESRDKDCQQYLSNRKNMRSIKAMSSHLKSGRTIKFKIFYFHNHIQAIVKVSQQKFFFEPASEYLAYSIDRELNFSRIPITAYVPLPLDYMRAAAGVLSPFFSQWFEGFVPEYDYTKANMVPCSDEDKANGRMNCALTAVQLWMDDVHSALMSYLAVPYEYDSHFAAKFYTPRTHHRWPPKPHRFQAITDILDRFIFDFIIGNTDRGMNDHNNFVYGGCDDSTPCHPEEPEHRTKGKAKYAFIDHGSSFHSHKEPEGNPFTGNLSDIEICRFRPRTYKRMLQYAQGKDDPHSHPFVNAIKARLPKGIFHVVRVSVFKTIQARLDKVLQVAHDCIARYSESEVLSLPDE